MAILTRIKIFATHLVTYLLAAQTILTTIIASGHLDSFPEALRVATVILGAIGVVMLVIRQYAPVPADQTKGVIEAKTADVTTSPKSP